MRGRLIRRNLNGHPGVAADHQVRQGKDFGRFDPDGLFAPIQGAGDLHGRFRGDQGGRGVIKVRKDDHLHASMEVLHDQVCHPIASARHRLLDGPDDPAQLDFFGIRNLMQGVGSAT